MAARGYDPDFGVTAWNVFGHLDLHPSDNIYRAAHAGFNAYQDWHQCGVD
jgi:hypothetical protein